MLSSYALTPLVGYVVVVNCPQSDLLGLFFGWEVKPHSLTRKLLNKPTYMTCVFMWVFVT